MLNTISVKEILTQQRQFFATGQSKNIDFRIEQLKKLKQSIINNYSEITTALKQDLNKPEFETFFELNVTNEIDYTIKNLKKWTKPQKIKPDFTQFPSTGIIYPEPLGVVLIIGPWNYPFSLVISPLMGAIAAGNCAIIKPSELAPHTSKITAQIIENTFASDYIAVQQGGIETSQELLQEKFDHIFFTGGTQIGKIIMQEAAKNLTPVTLELGGKSPCIVDQDINIKETAKRITWGKFINAGQTCIAPDYLLVNSSIKSELLSAMKQCIQDFYGENPALSPDFARIINSKQFNRLVRLLGDGEIIIGGKTDADSLYISPTIIDHINLDSPIMAEEIFGPILPVLTYQNLDEVLNIINNKPKPLALYVFSNDQNKQNFILKNTSSGGVCINDTIMQVGVTELPFGGVGDSGIGAYHGKATFDTFSHFKSVLKKGFRFDLNWRYAPYQKNLATMKKMLGFK
jgi:acyl-CoA reductase-like NAD-dependent aldehyde dehydrogenase